MSPLGCALLAVAALLVGGLLGRLWGVRAAAVRRGERPVVGRRRAEVAELAQRVVESADSGLVVLDGSGDVVLANPRAAALGVVHDGEVEPRAAAAAQRVRAGAGSVEVDVSPLAARGRPPSAVLAHVRPLGDGCTVVEAADTSDAVRLEATRRDFVANVSHELKTPVGAVALLAEAVLDAADDPAEVRRFAAKVLAEATRLGALVTELIALSRLTGAERLPELADVDVDEVVSEAMERCRVSAESAGIEITVDEPSGEVVAGDRTLLVTALSNLVENAVAYSPRGARVSVSRRRVDGRVEVSVTDRGIGIALAHQERVFERFFRVDPARSRATGGTGLGLAIVKHVVANHGGRVRLWSRPGTGSTFTMQLPAAEVDRRGAARPTAGSTRGQT